MYIHSVILQLKLPQQCFHEHISKLNKVFIFLQLQTCVLSLRFKECILSVDLHNISFSNDRGPLLARTKMTQVPS